MDLLVSRGYRRLISFAADAGYLLDLGGSVSCAGALELRPASGQRDVGVPRRPGGPPHRCISAVAVHLSSCSAAQQLQCGSAIGFGEYLLCLENWSDLFHLHTGVDRTESGRV